MQKVGVLRSRYHLLITIFLHPDNGIATDNSSTVMDVPADIDNELSTPCLPLNCGLGSCDKLSNIGGSQRFCPLRGVWFPIIVVGLSHQSRS